MTSSLVGSEMCIRDRKLRVPLLDEGSCDALVLESTPSVISVGERCLGPVSYTHLTLPTICSV
eukprot:7535698-Prorocentrum_lima.AAC.1